MSFILLATLNLLNGHNLIITGYKIKDDRKFLGTVIIVKITLQYPLIKTHYFVVLHALNHIFLKSLAKPQHIYLRKEPSLHKLY